MRTVQEIREMIENIGSAVNIADCQYGDMTVKEYDENIGWLNALRWVLGELNEETECHRDGESELY